MVMYGHPTSDLAFSRIVQVGNGYGLMNTIGCGYQTIPGAGPPFTMVVGFMMRIMDGCGCRVTNGHRRGYHGAVVVIIMVGLHYAPVLV